MPEDELLKAVLGRDAGAWSGFFRRYERLIISCIKKVLHRYTAVYGDEDIEDMVSTVCLNLVKDDYRKLRTYDPSRGYKLSSWVGLIATNTAHDALRRREPIHQRLDDHNADEAKVEIVDAEPNPGERMERREEWTALLRAIRDLPESDRQFLELYYDHEYEPEEIARRLGISVNTVYSRKNKVREKLRRLIEALDAGKVEPSRP
jgi:RNA polymerase sigma-70 factor (ECF subfamily)